MSKTRHLQYEPMEGRSLMVEIFGLGTVEIDATECGGSPCLDIYVHPAGDVGSPVASMRTYVWNQTSVSEDSAEKKH